METCYVPSLFWCCLLLFYFILLLNPFVSSTAHLSNPHRPRLTNASDQQALLAFKSAITYDPYQSLATTWMPNVSFCHWTGIICSSRRQRVVSLNVSSMGLQGTISPLLANLSFLTILDLHNNSLDGHIPYQLGTLVRLKMLRLSLNQLQGSIPPTLGSCRNLRNLTLSFNNLTGYIPPQLCVLPNLITMFLAVNNLMGTIPNCLGNISSLQYLELGDNTLHGSVPSELGMLSQLRVLTLGVNHLTGHIPSSLSNCHIPSKLCSKKTAHLRYLSLGANRLSGSIPSSLFNCTNLQVIILAMNQLSGTVPMELGKLTHLERLYFANFQQLRYLDLNHNQLSGNILANLGKCVNLLELDLSYNKFSGHIPPEVAGLANLAFYFNLSNNLLHGHLPLELSKLNKLQAIDISANQLTGYIPSALGSCKEISYLNLSCNKLQGSIPLSFSELQSLQDLDLSSNNLSGGIPISLENLTMLCHLNFSFNKLSGEIPKGGVFKKIGATAFMGNLGLCGPWVSLSPCYSHKHKSVLNLKRVIILVVAIATIVVLCLFMRILWRKNCKRHIPRETSPSLNVGHQRISYAELVIATNEFSDANLLGIGSFGKVYKGILNDGTMVDVKLLNLQNEGAQKSFDKECKVLGRVRHRNLIRVIPCYLDLQIKALIFPLMPNGSLERWLYPDDGEQSGLSLTQRLNITIDIAQGMTYLHHHCFVQVIHCDLKPNNVLLGEDMTAYLIDFGIATICFANNKDAAFTSTNALKGSIGYIPPGII